MLIEVFINLRYQKRGGIFLLVLRWLNFSVVIFLVTYYWFFYNVCEIS